MKELKDTHCEVKKIVDLQYPNWNFSKALDDESSEAGSPRSNGYSNVLGGFLEDANYAWLSSGPKLIVFNTKTGTNISSWTFKEQISCISLFPNQPGQLPLLLVGTNNNASRLKDSFGMVCIFNCTTSQVVRAIKVPTGVEQLCVINGGAEWEELNEKRVNNPLLENSSGLACVTLKNLDHLMIDLRRNSWDNPLRFPCIDESNPAEIDYLDSGNTSRHRTNREKHSACNLMNELIERHIGFKRDEFESSILYQESLTTVLTCSRKIGCLISGCLGRVIIWQGDGVVRWISPAVEDNLMISHLALLEPTDDPRPFCYLWIAYQDESTLYCPILKMYAMLFETKCSDKGINFYFNLEGEPSLKFELELEEKSKVISLDPIVRESNPEQTESGNKRGEDSLLLINIEGKSILFDLNQWYKEQMPRFLGECPNIQAILSSYSTKSEIPSSENTIVNCSYILPTLKEFSCSNSTPPEEFFFPNSLSFEWIQLGTKQLIRWMTRGVQAQLLRELVIAGPIIIIQPTESYHRCITTGLISFNSDLPYNNDLDSQRDAILTLCLEQRWTTFLLKCAKEWSDGSAAYLYPAFLRWSIQRASTIKLSTHELCIPLFDQSGNSIGEAEVKTLRFFSQQMECLCNVINNLPIETEDVEQQRRALRRISMYLEILLWFYDVGLLPETQDMDEEMLPISLILRIPYPVDKLVSIYKEKREQFAKNVRVKHENEEDLFIDELITRECPALRRQWEQESNEVHCGGHYPPPSLQSLLRSCLIDCYNPDSNEIENKHQIIIYLLMDLVMLLQGSCPNVDQLIKYPSAFKFSPGLIKLTQALFLLDHEDYQGFLDIMTGQLVFDSDIKDWHHRLVMRTLLRSNQSKLALIYLRVRKPPLSSIDDQSIAVILSVERGLVQSAFHRRPPTHYTELLMRFFRACKVYGKLNDILHLALNNEEEETFIHFLEQEKCDETRLLYYLQRCRYTDANTIVLTDSNIKNLAKTQKPASISIFHAYNATLPEISRRLTSNFIQNNIEMDSSSKCPRPMSHQKSRVKTREIYETAIRKAKETYLRRPVSDKSRVPFLSAPCLLSQPTLENTDLNCVMFVERARTFHGKRSFDDMRGEDIHREERLNMRKRQKISDLSEKVNESVAELGTMCQTPLIKRKSQVPLMKEISNETPQSILKIRQLICDSTSPSGKVSSSEDERAPDKEKKLRQIRFSINQPKTHDSTIEDMEICDGEVTQKTKDESTKQRVASEDQQKAERSPSSQRTNLSPKNVNQPCDVSIESDDYFSPNASTKSFHESAVLTDSSTYYSKSISGPRCRPRLRRSQLYNSQNDITKKSSGHNTSSESITDSIESTVDAFLKSDIVSSTFIDGFIPKTPRSRARLSAFSQCASAVLTPDTSVEIPCPQPNRALKSLSFSPSTAKKDDTYSTDYSDKEKSIVNSQQYSSTKMTVMKKKSFEEVDDQSDESESVEIVDEIQKQTEVKSEVKRETKSLEVRKIIREKHNVIISSDNSTGTQFSSEEKKDVVTNDQNDEIISESHEDEVVIIENRTMVAEDDKESFKAVDDYEDELVALKYEDEEENDVYESLHNSMEIEYQDEYLANNASQAQVSPKKTPIGKFYEEFNITDDESSRSVHSDMMEGMVLTKSELVQNLSQATTTVLSDSVNITDDETTNSIDSSHFKKSDSDKKTNDNLRTETDTSVLDLKVKDQKSCDNMKELSQPQTVESLKEITSSENVEEIVIPEDTTPIRMTRSRRASSVAPSLQESVSETPETRSIRTRRANSLAKDVFSPSKLTPTVSSGSDSPVESPVRRGRGRRSVSLIKEVLTTSILPERILGEINETTPTRQRLRRAVSLQKEIMEPTKKIKSAEDAPSADEKSEQEPDIPKKTRGRRAASVNKDIDKSTVVPRKTRGASVAKEDDDVEKNNKSKRVRAASTSSEIAQETIVEHSHPAKRTRTTSVSKEPANGSVVKETKSKRIRAASVAQENSKETTEVVEENLNEVSIPRRTRAASVSKDSVEETSKKNRGGSVSKDSIGDIVRKTRGGSVVREDIGETSRKTRGGSVSKDNVEESLRKTRGESVAREDVKETAPRKKRAASVSKESAEESSMTSQKIRTTSMIKDSTEDVESTGKRVTRRKGSTKDKFEEKIKTKKSHILNDVIIEEDDDDDDDDDEKETIFDKKITRRGSKNIEENVDIASTTRKIRTTSITAIPEENEEDQETQKKEKTSGRGRLRRAASVDLPTTETKRRTRGLARSAISEEHNEEEESHQMQTDTEMKSKKIPTRRKRAVSETKDVNNTVISVKPKRSTKGSQKKSGTDSQQSPPQEIDNSSETEMNNDVFSPPTVSLNTRSTQPRR
ncbi:protein ELYS isoform X2 [Chelonus insularis]|nr:protein ELYS isoform X2 [Chelonus insularis]